MVCFRLSTTLLLAAMCSLMAAVSSIESIVTCQGRRNVQRLSCGYGVIRVKKVLYGRQDSETCSEGRPSRQLANTKCSQNGTVDVLKSRCDGKKECELNINVVRRPNPCPGTFKYLNTTYGCFPAIHLTVCEGSVAQLQCAPGQIISVYGAHYGRTDRTTCSFRRRSSQTRRVNCSRSVTKKVSDSCNGKNNCTFDVSDTLFGDPCRRTYKYLEAAYVCEYPWIPALELDSKH